MTNTIADLLQQISFISDNEKYEIIHLPPRAITAAAAVIAEVGEAFSALIADKDEVTLILETESYAEYLNRLPDHRVEDQKFALITVDAVLSFDIVGLMAVLSKALAEASVPVFPYAAFSRDHILVPYDRLHDALNALNLLKEDTN